MTLRQLIGFVGAFLLLSGVFVPFVSIPLAGGLPLMRPGASAEGLLLLAIGLIAAGCVAARVALGGFVTGVVAVAMVGLSAASFFRIVAVTQEGLAADLRGNPFAPMGQLVLNAARLDAGFVMLLIGGLLLMGMSTLEWDTPPASQQATGVRLRLLRGWRAPVTVSWLATSVALIALGLVAGATSGERIAPVLLSGAPSAPAAGRSLDSRLEADLARAAAPLADPNLIRYRRYVRLTGLSVGRTVLDEPGVFGEVYNDGNRSLDEVEITIYFLDANGRTVFEKTYTPVLVSEYSFDRDGPLRPGYGRKFGVRADDAPRAWDQRVRVAVTNVKFSGGGR